LSRCPHGLAFVVRGSDASTRNLRVPRATPERAELLAAAHSAASPALKPAETAAWDISHVFAPEAKAIAKRAGRKVRKMFWNAVADIFGL